MKLKNDKMPPWAEYEETLTDISRKKNKVLSRLIWLWLYPTLKKSNAGYFAATTCNTHAKSPLQVDSMFA